MKKTILNLFISLALLIAPLVAFPAGIYIKPPAADSAAILAAAAADATAKADAALASSIAQFTGAHVLYSSNGYQDLPGGLILQWGQAFTGVGSVNVAFPKPFAVQVYSVTLTLVGVANSNATVLLTGVGNAAFSMAAQAGGIPVASQTVTWMAIGK